MLRLLTTEAVMFPYDRTALTNAQAWDHYERLRADPRIAWAEEPRGIDAVWKSITARPTSSPKIWMDAYLAAFAISGGHQLVTLDKAFVQFAGLSVKVLS